MPSRTVLATWLVPSMSAVKMYCLPVVTVAVFLNSLRVVTVRVYSAVASVYVSVSATVAVIVVVPWPTRLTRPSSSTVATSGFELV